MKRMAATIALVLLGLCIAAHANITMDTVAVGDAGNVGELSGSGAGGYGPDRICGSVSYTYNIGKYEVTAGQYTEFLNAKAKTDTYGLYNTAMVDSLGSRGCNIQRNGNSGGYSYAVASDWADRPVNYVSFWDACRFANWLGNGQGNGDTETGAYSLGGYNGLDGRTISRNAGATWAVTSEDEWYKAAYYMGGGTTAGYWDYATQSNSINDGMANYGALTHTTDVGSYPYSSLYGTFDQSGNVWEWNETGIVYGSHPSRVIRGGAFSCVGTDLRASYSDYSFPTGEASFIGFRVSQVPEPSSLITLLAGLAGLLSIRRRRA